uniref:hydrogenase (acceptor) n=1 Tax=Magnetococcus massalia (strain MO-1) TaxID=451514 RepID=A0A1S7LEZ2_MAGMO|nr:Uptake hydrogenase small subunit precursor (Hydrogenlyase) (Membrane-bound hydrogenase small subunit) [Candidatus Magnetococcus massalia]
MFTTDQPTLGQVLRQRGVSRRAFMKFCAATASMLALPPSFARAMAEKLESVPRPSVIWLSFQECTGCTEALTRSHAPSLEGLILDTISLDYHHTLQAASGDAAEKAREEAMHAHAGKFILIVDGSIPLKNPAYSTIAGIDNLTMLKETAAQAAAIVSVGTCAAYGGLPQADPNPTGAVSVDKIITDKPIINVPGCPPIPAVITGVLAHYLTLGRLPELDALKRPKVFYGDTVHDRCYRRTFYDQGLFADTFDDEGAKKGWCLFKLGCKGPTTYNACATLKWNGGVSFPIQSGHGCIGCSEPNFWDARSFYAPLSTAGGPDFKEAAVAAAAVGVAAGVASGLHNKAKAAKSKAAHTPLTLEELEGEQ